MGPGHRGLGEDNDLATARSAQSSCNGGQDSLDVPAGWVLLAFSALAAYLFFGSASHSTGAKEFPLGKPVLHS
jgi:hypothetical protein